MTDMDAVQNCISAEIAIKENKIKCKVAIKYKIIANISLLWIYKIYC